MWFKRRKRTFASFFFLAVVLVVAVGTTLPARSAPFFPGPVRVGGGMEPLSDVVGLADGWRTADAGETPMGIVADGIVADGERWRASLSGAGIALVLVLAVAGAAGGAGRRAVVVEEEGGGRSSTRLSNSSSTSTSMGGGFTSRSMVCTNSVTARSTSRSIWGSGSCFLTTTVGFEVKSSCSRATAAVSGAL